ncbi:MAG: 30S ribosome-binding factor RbfA [Eggerthellaceae bacterium]|nr:30S ribosome-binding factor RbfA [Eggerthellaceae bacterium]
MKEGNRKVDEQAREVISNIMLFDVSDPRLEMVTVTGCKVSYDRAYCDVYVTCEPDRYEEVLAALEAAKGHIRSLMAKKLDWRQAPELRFHLDETVDAAEKLGKYLNAEKERQATYEDTVGEGEEY